MSLKEKLSHKKLDELLKNVLQSLKEENTKETTDIHHPFCKYMYDHCVKHENKNNPNSTDTNKLMTETISLLESKDCCMVINQCLESSLDYVIGSLSDNFLGNEGNQHFFINV